MDITPQIKQITKCEGNLDIICTYEHDLEGPVQSKLENHLLKECSDEIYRIVWRSDKEICVVMKKGCWACSRMCVEQTLTEAVKL